LEEGPGFGIIKGLNPGEFSREQQQEIYWDMCNFLGEPMPQNPRGEIKVEVKDRGLRMEKGARYHQTSQGGSLHTDSPQWPIAPDIIGLLCLHPAMEGGESKLVSAYSIHNRILQESPELLDSLYEPFHFDKRGDVKPGESETTLAPIFTYSEGSLGLRYLRDYIVDGHDKVNDKLSEKRLEALSSVDRQLTDESGLVLTQTLRAGEIVFFYNSRIIHGRTGFTDYQETEKKRVMVRAWLKHKNE